MDLTLDQLHTYLSCPAKYKFKFIDNINLPLPKSVIFKKAVHSAVYYFFFSVLNERVPNANDMKNKWASIWKTQSGEVKDPLDIILNKTKGYNPLNEKKWRTQSDTYLLSGYEMIHNFYHFNNKNPGNIIAVDQDYRLALENVNIIGKFELIREVLDEEDGKRYIEVVDFKTNDGNIDPFLIKNDLNLTLASYAFRNLFDSSEDRMKYHYLKTGRDIITVRRESDYNRAKAIVKGVVNGIKNKDYYPRQSFMCKTCEFKDVCDRVKY